MQNSHENNVQGTRRNDLNRKDRVCYQTGVSSLILHLIGYFGNRGKIRLF